MPYNLFAIITNSFTQTLRQPVYLVVIAAALFLLVMGPSLAMFTLDDDDKLLQDVALSTLLVAGLFLAAFAAATVVTEEIENKTVLTVISKTVGRTTFVIGKFIGIAAAVILAQYLLSLALLMVARYGVMQTSADQPDPVVITFGSIAAGLTFLVGLAGNYFYRWRFSAAATITGAILATVAVALLALIDPHWNFNPAENHMTWNLIGPILLIYLATLILTAIAVAAATRLGLTMTLIICSLMFVLGVIMQLWVGPVAARTGVVGYLAWAAIAVVPSINVFVVTNAIYRGEPIPLNYLGQTAVYAFLYVAAVLMFAIALFRRREIS